MTGETFEYAIKKDIRNNPIVREVDRERHREMWRSMAHRRVPRRGASVLGVAALRAAAARLRIEQMQQERAAKRTVNRHLRLEIETLRSPARDRARWRPARSHMVAPDAGRCDGDRARRPRAGAAARQSVARR